MHGEESWESEGGTSYLALFGPGLGDKDLHSCKGTRHPTQLRMRTKFDEHLASHSYRRTVFARS